MTVKDLIEEVAVVETVGELNIEVSNLCYRSSEAVPGSLFFCVVGADADGHQFATEAARLGATAIVTERLLDLDLTEIVVADSRIAMAPIARRFFGSPTDRLQLVAVTGTNGKTTTAYLVRSILEQAGRQCGMLTTVEQVVAGESTLAKHTTPEAVDLQRAFRRMVEGGDKVCVMEVSSHALELHRSDGIDFDIAVFTNLTQDHLDFHGDMEQYFEAKRKLFFPTIGQPPRVSVIGTDDGYGRQLLKQLSTDGRNVKSFALDQAADYRATAIESSSSGKRFTLAVDSKEVPIQTNLPGLFNVKNVLAAVAACSELDVDLESIQQALKDALPAPGRFETVNHGQAFRVVVDYAHTPDALENVLLQARGICDGQLIVVFGCGGDRDRRKRPQMGAVVERIADRVYVTSDNPRNEDPAAIIEQIVAGTRGTSTLTEIVDRREAIVEALSVADSEDTVVIAGKGHERGQEFASGRKEPFDDREVVTQALEGLLGN